ncbi:MAG: 2,3-bisphosphoglycerate-dependent phosphoglycerate mutase [Sphingomonadaceae bacterium]|nr:2,3-bisphosphoglycerate-dependent phosphoglycerate mutase [Sphingomonadaceae bacterium]
MAEVHARLVLARHGESAINAANVFTGWTNPPLTAIGRDQASLIAHRLMDAKLYPDRIFSSPLDRCNETVAIILSVMGAPDVSATRNLALNERDYGALTGRNKDDAAAEYGAEQVRLWRRSYAVAPPQGESLRDTAARVLAYYVRTILPATMVGGTSLVVSHGNALRGLVMALDGMGEAEIEAFDLSTGATILYELGPTTGIVGRSVLA